MRIEQLKCRVSVEYTVAKLQNILEIPKEKGIKIWWNERKLLFLRTKRKGDYIIPRLTNSNEAFSFPKYRGHQHEGPWSLS